MIKWNKSVQFAILCVPVFGFGAFAPDSLSSVFLGMGVAGFFFAGVDAVSEARKNGKSQ